MRFLSKRIFGYFFLCLGFASILFEPFYGAPVKAKVPAGSVVLGHFPVYSQQHNLSCEYAAARIMTAYWGGQVGEAAFIRSIATSPNPHTGYRGSINGYFGGSRDYGIYAEPISWVLNAYGFKTRVQYGSADTLKQELSLGHPVQVWIVAGLAGSYRIKGSYNGSSFTLVPGEHSVVVYGYDQGGVYISDPGRGIKTYYSWKAFLPSWALFDNMSLSAWPAK